MKYRKYFELLYKFSPEEEEILNQFSYCFSCLRAGLHPIDALRSRDELVDGPKTSDLKCLHCYITEKEFGRFRPNRNDLETEIEGKKLLIELYKKGELEPNI
jgi:hypothetical protein